MTPKKCMSIAKSLTNTQHMELEPLCSVLSAPIFLEWRSAPAPALKKGVPLAHRSF